MRKFVLSLAAAGAALAIASPASAQYYPQPQPYGYGYGYNHHAQVRALQARIDRVQWQIRDLDRRNLIRDRQADRMRDDARQLERRLRVAARHGLHPREAHDIQLRLARIEQRVELAFRQARYGYGHGGYQGYRDRWDR